MKTKHRFYYTHRKAIAPQWYWCDFFFFNLFYLFDDFSQTIAGKNNKRKEKLLKI